LILQLVGAKAFVNGIIHRELLLANPCSIGRAAAKSFTARHRRTEDMQSRNRRQPVQAQSKLGAQTASFDKPGFV
jgi:hypothetical protein